jgi:hypothetical protein
MDWNARVRSHLTVGEDEVIEELAQHARTEYETDTVLTQNGVHFARGTPTRSGVRA